ncbi:MAG: glutathione S-transferase [Rhodospirillaceae bacterium]|jgi:glutathione S-transferase|nr:glutathione S-transferase [Rhodospirillaceae bacterium]
MVKVLGRNNSINVQKVMWCAAELGVDVDRHNIGLEFGGNDTPEYLAKNPNGLIPTLEDGELTVWESNTIVRYLSDEYGSGDWALNTAADRARASQWMDWYLTTMHAPLSLVFRALVRTPEAERDMAAVEKGVATTNRLWSMLESHLDGRNFVMGDKPSIGDIPVGCAVYRWYAMDVERPPLPNVTAWYERLQQRAPYQEHVMMPLT